MRFFHPKQPVPRSEGSRAHDLSRFYALGGLAIVVALSCAGRVVVGDRLLIASPAGSAAIESVLGALSITFAVAAIAKFGAQSEVRFLRLAVGAAAFGLIHLYSVVLGLQSPAGYATAPAPSVTAILGDAANLALVIGVALSLLDRPNRMSTRLAPIGVVGLVIGAVLLSRSPASAKVIVQALLDLATVLAALVSLLGVSFRRTWQDSPMRPWLMVALCIFLALEFPLPGVATEFSHRGVSLVDALTVTGISVLVDGGMAALLTDFRLLRATNRDLAESNLRLDKAARDVERAARVRETFLGMVSHELRTPLNAVVGFAQLLAADDDFGPKHRRQVARIQEGAQLLAARIEDILALTSAESSTSTAGESIDAPSLLEADARVARMAARLKGLELDVDFGPGALPAGCEIFGRAVANVVDNAVKFSGSGIVTVRGAMDGDSYRVTVTDHGPGIQPEQLSRIFEGFAQADEGTHRHFGGLGLGLTVAHRLVTAMGGKITVESEPGTGATFVLKVPAHERVAALIG